MNKLIVGLFLLPLGQGVAFAQTGDAQAGKAFWDGPAAQCRNCHGEKGEGAFGPDLAGPQADGSRSSRMRSASRGASCPPISTVRSPTPRSPNMVAYFDSLPANAQPGKWRFEVPADAARGQMVSLNVGCGQCHGPILNGPRQNMGAIDGTFEDFKGQVYDHTTTYPPIASGLRSRCRLACAWAISIRRGYGKRNCAKSTIGRRTISASVR